jgi:hypothetical protein
MRWLLVAVMVAAGHAAQAHGIVGNRVFPGTLAFDDPAVMDELVFPAAASLKHPSGGADVTDNLIGWSFTRLLTPTFSVGIEGGWLHRNWGVAQRSGFDTTALTLKSLLYQNELHEVMISAGLAWGIRGSGAQGVGANSPDTIEPSVFFGKGFGDLPDWLAWLRPLAVTGAVTLAHPMSGDSINSAVDRDTGQLGPGLTRNVDTLHWGILAPVQHVLSHQPLHPGQASQGGAGVPAHSAGRVRLRYAPRRKDRRHHESGIGLRGGRVAGGRRSDRTAQ